MKKFDENLEEDSTFNKCGGNEEIFILREQDKTAGMTVVRWIELNFQNLNCSDEKLRSAFESAMKMRINILLSKNAD